jgi:hypothetical protein
MNLPDQRITQVIALEIEADLLDLLAESTTNQAHCFQIPLLRLARIAEQMEEMLSQAIKKSGHLESLALEHPVEYLCALEKIDLVAQLLKEHPLQLTENTESIISFARTIYDAVEDVLLRGFDVAEDFSLSEITHLCSDAVIAHEELGTILQLHFPKIGPFLLPPPLSWIEIYELIGLKHRNN